MSLQAISWIICGIIWAVVIVGFIGTVVFNRIRNRRHKDNSDRF